MSRAVNIDATQNEVIAVAAKYGAANSAIEPLHPRGTRVVFMNVDGTALVTRAFETRIITAAVTRLRSGRAQCRLGIPSTGQHRWWATGRRWREQNHSI